MEYAVAFYDGAFATWETEIEIVPWPVSVFRILILDFDVIVVASYNALMLLEPHSIAARHAGLRAFTFT
jgi:hypothetical protein